jgi:hypothetical protein
MRILGGSRGEQIALAALAPAAVSSKWSSSEKALYWSAERKIDVPLGSADLLAGLVAFLREAAAIAAAAAPESTKAATPTSTPGRTHGARVVRALAIFYFIMGLVSAFPVGYYAFAFELDVLYRIFAALSAPGFLIAGTVLLNLKKASIDGLFTPMLFVVILSLNFGFAMQEALSWSQRQTSIKRCHGPPGGDRGPGHGSRSGAEPSGACGCAGGPASRNDRSGCRSPAGCRQGSQ